MRMILLLLSACAGKGSDDRDGRLPPAADSATPTGDDTGDDTSSPDDTAPPPLECDPLPALPLDVVSIRGTPASEDFAFDLEGRMVNVDRHGNLVATNIEGDRTVLVPGMGYTAGLAYLPDGTIVFNDVDSGALKRTDPATGAVETLTAGLAYPNGLGVDLDGFVYVAENAGNRVRRIDPLTGDAEIISTDTLYPNGVSFSPDYQTVYIGSFGGGSIYAISRDADGAWETRILSHLPPPTAPDTCETMAEGDACFFPHGGVGACRSGDDSALRCQPGYRDTAACEGLSASDPCTTEFFGETISSNCQSSGAELFCPSISAGAIEACGGRWDYTSCMLDGEEGYCMPSWQAVGFCYTTAADADAANTCEGLSAGEDCVYRSPYLPSNGQCQEAGTGYMTCLPTYSSGAPLDGINTDACGTVYATDYGSGSLWRITPDASVVEVAANLSAFWIPNLHFGRGLGGFSDTRLYVMNYDRGGLFEVDIGLPGRAEAYPTP